MSIVSSATTARRFTSLERCGKEAKMKDQKLVAKASTAINAPAAEVWDALVDPKKIKQFMFGTNVVSDWKKGSPIVWKGEWKGKKYEDKGVILQMERERL